MKCNDKRTEQNDQSGLFYNMAIVLVSVQEKISYARSSYSALLYARINALRRCKCKTPRFRFVMIIVIFVLTYPLTKRIKKIQSENQ